MKLLRVRTGGPGKPGALPIFDPCSLDKAPLGELGTNRGADSEAEKTRT
jgi:hypothetical protein